MLILGKVAALIALGWFGTMHRRRTLRELDAGRPHAFRRLAAGEIVVMASALALGVTLSRTSPPPPDDLAPASFVRELLGFPIPPEPSPLRLLTQTYPDALFALGCLAAVLLYLAGLWRLRRRGDRWPAGRTVAWLLGVGSVALVQLSGLMTYGMTMLSVHMGQHIALMMISPVLLVLGGPVTLALRATTPARRGETGPRGGFWPLPKAAWFGCSPIRSWRWRSSSPGRSRVLHRPVRVRDAQSHRPSRAEPALPAGRLPLLRSAYRRRPAGQPPYVARLGLQLLAVAIHAFFGLALMESARLIAGGYYRQLGTEISWLPEPLPDQILAGQLTWGFAELPGLLVLGVLFVQWYRSDEREARRFDRREGDAEAERVRTTPTWPSWTPEPAERSWRSVTAGRIHSSGSPDR